MLKPWWHRGYYAPASITFWREFGGVFLGDFLEPTGLGASAGGDFPPKHPRMVRWASADLVLFSTFFAFFDRFLPVFVPYFALFSSMPCAYLYVHDFPRTHVTLLRQGFHRRPAGFGGQVGGQGRFGRENLAFDKETALDGQRLRVPAVEPRQPTGPGVPAEPGARPARESLSA